MGLFDKVSTDGTGTTQQFTQQAVAFAKMDLNAIFKMTGQGVTSLITNAIAFFKDVFGNSKCNDQDRVLVERFYEQIPGMMLLLAELGYLSETFIEPLRNDPNEIYKAIAELGRPKGAEPCNSLLYPARLTFAILFGVRILNDKYLDALDRGVDEYLAVDNGDRTWDIPRNAVERAVLLKQNFFPIETYNREQWDLNKFQEYPLVAPIPDPVDAGGFYTGEFLGVKIVNGWAIGDPIPDIQQYIDVLENVPSNPNHPIDIGTLPTIPVPGTETGNGSGTPPAGQGDFFTRAGVWIEAHPVESFLIGAAALYAAYELTKKKKRKSYG